MIPNQWYAILESEEVKVGKPNAFRRMGEQLVVWRDKDNQPVIMRDRCPHRRSELSPGKIVDGNIECFFHGFRYGPDGACTFVPANGRSGPTPKVFKVDTFPARDQYGFIWMWWGEEQDELPPVHWFPDLDHDAFTYNTYRDRWPVHYSRAIENQLDVAHLPFVHKNTIGRSGKTLVNGPSVTLENDELSVWTDNQMDTGLPAIKPSQMPPPNKPPQLRYIFPNIWENRISDKIRVIAAFTPIDDENTMMYLRFYQSAVKTPVVRRLMTKVGAFMNGYVAGEDKGIVSSQRPKQAGLNIGEKFIPADRPIAVYLIRRAELIEGAASTQAKVDTLSTAR